MKCEKCKKESEAIYVAYDTFTGEGHNVCGSCASMPAHSLYYDELKQKLANIESRLSELESKHKGD